MELLDLLVCPACRGELTAKPDALRCAACQRDYEVIHGIPDFRPDPPDRPRHGEFCREIISVWENSTYRELWGRLHPGDGDAVRRLQAEHERIAPQRGERRWSEIERASRAVGHAVATDGVALDIGCGIGSALFALGGRARLAVGLDILLTELLLAKKRLHEAGLANMALVCGSAVELPFRDGVFNVLNATDVIEHMPDQRLFLSEGRRVLSPQGCFFFNSPNRFSVFTPEPHVRLWWMGWLPRRWMEPYVRWRLGKPYRGKRLLSLAELRRLLRAEFGRRFAIWPFLPRGGPADLPRRFLGALAKPLLPQHNVLAWK